jgi:hypothetical protein
MNPYRERLGAYGFLKAYDQAKEDQNIDAMQRILESVKFSQLEIESIIWAKGDIGAPATEEEKKKDFWDDIVGRIGIAIISGLILGGVFVYSSSGLEDADRRGQKRSEVLMKDYRSPKEAYYRPFIWGFSIGVIGGLITGSLLYDPTEKKNRA